MIMNEYIIYSDNRKEENLNMPLISVFRTNAIDIFSMYDDVVIPKKQTEQSACWDVSAYLNGDHVRHVNIYDNRNTVLCSRVMHNKIYLMPGCRAVIPTGMKFDIMSGYSIRLHVRSSCAVKQGLVLINQEGIIDADYVDQIFLPMMNTSNEPIIIEHGQRICQMEIVPVYDCTIGVLTTAPSQKGNRTGGIGSTGTK